MQLVRPILEESEIIEIETSQDEALTIEAIRRNGRVCPELCKQLVDYRNNLCKVKDEQDCQVPLLFGVEIISGLPNATIHASIQNRDSAKSAADILSLGVTYESCACCIYEILNRFVKNKIRNWLIITYTNLNTCTPCTHEAV